MRRSQITGILLVLLSGIIFTACGGAESERVLAQPLMLATLGPLAAGDLAGAAVPQQIVVVLVTPTPAQDTVGQRTQDQQDQVQGGGQAVAQAQDDASGDQQDQGQTTEGEQGNGGQIGDQELISMGEPIYSSNCASCHQPNGEGTSSYPPLAGSEALTGEDPSSAIQTVVNGRGQMPAFGDSLSAEDIAAVISYERNSWGNSAGTVSADQVSQVQQGGAAQGETAQEQPSPTPEAQGQQAGATGEVQAQPGSVVTIRIEIVIVTPEAGAAPAAQGDQAAAGEAQTTPTPSPESADEAGATQTEQPTQEAQTTPEPEGDSNEASATPEPTPAGEGQTTPVPEFEQPPATAEPEEGEAQATPTVEGEREAAEATATPEGESGEDTGAAASTDEEVMRLGEQIYGTTCANCHQLSGEGNTAYPSLNNNAIVTAEDPTEALSIILNGRGQMPSFGGTLSDEEIAAVLSHERNSWDNRASLVTVDQVRQARAGGAGQAEGAGEEEKTGQEQAEPTPAPPDQSAETQATPSPQDQTRQPEATNAPPTAAAQEGTEGTEAPPDMAAVTIQAGGTQTSAAAVIQIQIVVVTPAPSDGAVAPAAGTPVPEEDEEGTSAQGEEGPSDEVSATAAPDEQATGAGPPAAEQLIASGQSLFAPYCAACHQAEGQGIDGVYPALDGNAFVTADDPYGVIEVVLTGRGGMPHFGQFLETPEIAALISYIRNAWNNRASTVTAEEVERVGQAVGVAGEEGEH
jgi:mono/diheme cytochrome c family protein